MKREYELSKLKSRKNPYASKLKKSVTMRLSSGGPVGQHSSRGSSRRNRSGRIGSNR